MGMLESWEERNYPFTLTEGTHLLLASDSYFTLATYPCAVIEVTGG
jgi:hypothetical protein